MEPDKNIKDKLNAREIQPSANSWDRLDAMLSLEEKPKKNTFPFYYVAASVLFALGLTFWFTNQNAEVIIPQNNGIVITNENIPSEVNEVENTVSNQILEEKVNEVLVIQQELKLSDKITPTQILNKKKNSVVEKPKSNPSEIRNQKSEIVNQYISPEKLLVSVENGTQNEIGIVVSKPNKTSVKVNPNSLLSSVENEIDEEYRETTLDKLKRNFSHVKTAVANRNYE